MRDIARDLGKRLGKEHWVRICENLEKTMEREKQLCANVDLYAAPVFTMLDFPPELNTPIFAASRVAGWCAHVIEQHDHQQTDSSALALHRPAVAALSGLGAGRSGVTRVIDGGR